MDGNKFTICSTWDWRPERALDIGQKFIKTLDTLSAINTLFHPWELSDYEGEIKETGFALPDVRDRIVDIIERGVFRDEHDEPFPAGGYKATAVNRRYLCPEGVRLSVEAGGHSQFSRSARFETDDYEIPTPSIVAYPVFKTVLTTLVSIWNVAKAEAYSWELTRYWDDPPFNFDLNWMVYLSAPLASRIVPPKDVLLERMDGGGLLMIAAEETFDTTNRQHLLAARLIRDALAPLNDLEQHERDKRRKDEAERQLKASGFPGKMIRRKPRPLPR